MSRIKPDPLLTKEKFAELKSKLEHLKSIRPKQAEEVSRLADLGDFSENAGYQFAKSRLRGINSGIAAIEKQLTNAEIIITEEQTDTVQVGHTVTIKNDGKAKTYQLLGSTETNPQKGIISYLSPIGAALIGHSVGDIVTIKITSAKGGSASGRNKEVGYTITKIEV